MASFFPQVTGTFRLEEPPALRRLTMSPIAMGVIAGIVLRLYRAFTLSVGPNESMLYVGSAFILGQMVLLGIATLHLGSFTLRRWLYLTPIFAVAEAVTEALVSLALIAAGLERLGSTRAVFSAWPGLALSIGLWRIGVLLLYAALLAGVVQLVRYLLLRRGHRDHTLDAVAEDGDRR
ncbi:MAG: hypothetical protein ACT4P7_22590 [Gemmatimonadaceae bacterium]